MKSKRQPSDRAGDSSGRPKAEPAQAVGTRERQLNSLSVLSLFLHSTATVQEMMSMLLEQAPAVTGAVLIYPMLVDRKRQLLRASILEGCTDPQLETAMDAFQEDLTALEYSLVSNPRLHSLLEDGEVVLSDDAAMLMDGVLSDEQRKVGEKALNIRKVALAPMVVENEPLGAVAFFYDQADVDVDVAMLELLVGHLTLALRALIIQDEVVRFSDIDPVTWLPNARFLKHTLENEVVRGGRYGRGLALIALDIDGFGEFNETYGQTTGDRLLRAVATTLAEAVSRPELVARYQDDDFIVLLPETSRATAVTVTTRMLTALSQVSVFDGDEDAPPVTMSVAIACFPDDADTPRALLNRVLSDLEQAKRDRGGRNQDETDVA